MTNATVNDAALQAVLQNQDQIKATEATIAKVEAAIREQQEKIIAETVPARPDLYEGKADILARLALGKADAGDLARIDALVAAHEEATKAAEKKIGPMRAAVEGLTRRAEQERDALKRLTHARETLRLAFYRDQEEQRGVRVRELADTLHVEFGGLVALSMLSGSGLVSQATPYIVPTLRLAAFNDVRDRDCLHDMGQLAGPGKAEGLKTAEVERLRSLGVE